MRAELELVKVKTLLQGYGDEQEKVKSDLESLRNEHGTIKSALEGPGGVTAEIRELGRTVTHLRTNLTLQENRLDTLLAEPRKRLPEPFTAEQFEVMVHEEKHLLDPLFASFEDRFRGTREEIKERMKVYLPFLKETGIGTEEMPVLDLGCGLGDWLELLGEERLQGRGVDHNRLSVQFCQDKGFEVVEDDMVVNYNTKEARTWMR